MCICVWEVCGRVSFCCEVFPVLSVKEKHPGEVTGEKAPHAHTLMHLLHRRPAFPSSRSLHTQMDDVIRRLGGRGRWELVRDPSVLLSAYIQASSPASYLQHSAHHEY